MEQDVTFSLAQVIWLCGGLMAIVACIGWLMKPINKLNDHETRIKALEQQEQERKAIEKTSVNLTDSEAFDVAELFPMWKVDTAYQTGDRVQYEGKLYKCLQSHTSQADWKPTEAVSLWVRVDDPSVEFPEWVQPTGAQDAYAKNSKVSHNEKHWISDVDNNVWEPGVYGWTEV